MRSGLLFKLPIRKPNILLADKHLFGYTFLESESLDDALKADPISEPNKSIIEFIKKPFSVRDLQASSFLKDKVKQHLLSTEKCYNSLRRQKEKIAQNIIELAHKNILDIEIWRKVFAEVLEFRFGELQEHPDLGELFMHMEAYFSKFDTKNSKFYLDKAELTGLLTLRENCTDMFNQKKKLGSIRLQTNIINFFTKASSKVPVNLERMRKYYVSNLILKLPQVLAKENSIVDIAKLQTSLDTLYLAKRKIRQVFEKRVEELMSNQDNLRNFNHREYLAIATNWGCLGVMRQPYQKIFSATFDALVHESPAALLQAVVTCHKETPQLIERLLEVLDSKPFEILSRKPQIHRVLHVLEIRGYDLSKYAEFVERICEQNCDKLNPQIAKVLQVPIRSKCMLPEYFKDTTSFSPNIQIKWVSGVLKTQFAPKMPVFAQTKVCRFDVMFGFVKDDKLYVLQIPGLNKVTNKTKNYRGTIKQKDQVLQYYGIKKVQLDIPNKRLKYILTKKDKEGLIKEVKALIQSL